MTTNGGNVSWYVTSLDRCQQISWYAADSKEKKKRMKNEEMGFLGRGWEGRIMVLIPTLFSHHPSKLKGPGWWWEEHENRSANLSH